MKQGWMPGNLFVRYASHLHIVDMAWKGVLILYDSHVNFNILWLGIDIACMGMLQTGCVPLLEANMWILTPNYSTFPIYPLSWCRGCFCQSKPAAWSTKHRSKRARKECKSQRWGDKWPHDPELVALAQSWDRGTRSGRGLKTSRWSQNRVARWDHPAEGNKRNTHMNEHKSQIKMNINILIYCML
jgi:hypothetical protein